MAREKGMGNLQREKFGRWTMRVSIDGKRYCRSTLEAKRNVWLAFARWMGRRWREEVEVDSGIWRLRGGAA